MRLLFLTLLMLQCLIALIMVWKIRSCLKLVLFFSYFPHWICAGPVPLNCVVHQGSVYSIIFLFAHHATMLYGVKVVWGTHFCISLHNFSSSGPVSLVCWLILDGRKWTAFQIFKTEFTCWYQTATEQLLVIEFYPPRQLCGTTCVQDVDYLFWRGTCCW